MKVIPHPCPLTNHSTLVNKLHTHRRPPRAPVLRWSVCVVGFAVARRGCARAGWPAPCLGCSVLIGPRAHRLVDKDHASCWQPASPRMVLSAGRQTRTLQGTQFLRRRSCLPHCLSPVSHGDPTVYTRQPSQPGGPCSVASPFSQAAPQQAGLGEFSGSCLRGIRLRRN